MDGANLQGKIYKGYAKAAAHIGLPCSQYRPTSATGPVIASGNLLSVIQGSFNAQDMAYGKPNAYGKPLWYCLADGRLLQVGDYLVRSDGAIYFIAGMQPLLPILSVECNRMVDVLRPQQLSGPGVAEYGGNTAATETGLMSGWPASILQGTKGDRSDANLPGDTRNPYWSILLPIWPEVNLRSGDIVADDIDRRYVISSAELSDLGWRITAAQAQT
jgi:hypothetical protein